MSEVTITAAEINKLRQMTGAGMMDCRKALTENNGDFEAAIDWLRKKGQKVAALRGDRDAKEGVVLAKTNAANSTGIALCLSCETDFVSKNTDFIAFAQSIIDAAVAHDVKSAEELNTIEIGGAKIADLVNDKLASIGEKIGISKFERIDAAFVSSYIHGANRMGVLVGLSAEEAEVGKDVAMQIAAMNPVAIDPATVSAEVVEREKAIIVDLIKNDPKMAGKPDEMISKIADGKLNAFFKESTLLAQAFVKDGGMSVGDYIKSKGKDLSVVAFKRVALG
jgi:elongation factor Ts